jgi:hypothetical protein
LVVGFGPEDFAKDNPSCDKRIWGHMSLTPLAISRFMDSIGQTDQMTRQTIFFDHYAVSLVPVIVRKSQEQA